MVYRGHGQQRSRGYCRLVCAADGRELGFVLDRHGGLTTLEIPGAYWTDALDVNNAGTVVGFYSDGGYPRGFIYEDGVYDYPIDIQPPNPDAPIASTWLEGINNRDRSPASRPTAPTSPSPSLWNATAR